MGDSGIQSQRQLNSNKASQARGAGRLSRDNSDQARERHSGDLFGVSGANLPSASNKINANSNQAHPHSLSHHLSVYNSQTLSRKMNRQQEREQRGGDIQQKAGSAGQKHPANHNPASSDFGPNYNINTQNQHSSKQTPTAPNHLVSQEKGAISNKNSGNNSQGGSSSTNGSGLLGVLNAKQRKSISSSIGNGNGGNSLTHHPGTSHHSHNQRFKQYQSVDSKFVKQQRERGGGSDFIERPSTSGKPINDKLLMNLLLDDEKQVGRQQKIMAAGQNPNLNKAALLNNNNQRAIQTHHNGGKKSGGGMSSAGGNHHRVSRSIQGANVQSLGSLNNRTSQHHGSQNSYIPVALSHQNSQIINLNGSRPINGSKNKLLSEDLINQTNQNGQTSQRVLLSSKEQQSKNGFTKSIFSNTQKTTKNSSQDLLAAQGANMASSGNQMRNLRHQKGVPTLYHYMGSERDTSDRERKRLGSGRDKNHPHLLQASHLSQSQPNDGGNHNNSSNQSLAMGDVYQVWNQNVRNSTSTEPSTSVNPLHTKHSHSQQQNQILAQQVVKHQSQQPQNGGLVDSQHLSSQFDPLNASSKQSTSKRSSQGQPSQSQSRRVRAAPGLLMRTEPSTSNLEATTLNQAAVNHNHDLQEQQSIAAKQSSTSSLLRGQRNQIRKMHDSANQLSHPSTPSLIQLDQAKKNGKLSQGLLASSKAVVSSVSDNQQTPTTLATSNPNSNPNPNQATESQASLLHGDSSSNNNLTQKRRSILVGNLESNNAAKKQQRAALQAVLKAANNNKFFNLDMQQNNTNAKTVPNSVAQSPREDHFQIQKQQALQVANNQKEMICQKKTQKDDDILIEQNFSKILEETNKTKIVPPKVVKGQLSSLAAQQQSNDKSGPQQFQLGQSEKDVDDDSTPNFQTEIKNAKSDVPSIFRQQQEQRKDQHLKQQNLRGQTDQQTTPNTAQEIYDSKPFQNSKNQSESSSLKPNQSKIEISGARKNSLPNPPTTTMTKQRSGAQLPVATQQQTNNSEERHNFSAKKASEKQQKNLLETSQNPPATTKASSLTTKTSSLEERKKEVKVKRWFNVTSGAAAGSLSKSTQDPFSSRKNSTQSVTSIAESLVQHNPEQILNFDNPIFKPKNVVKKFAFATRVGYEPGNPEKQNQDAFILAPNIQDRQSLHLFGVCDGHGPQGRDAANFVKFALHVALEQRYPDEGSETEEKVKLAVNQAFQAVQASFKGNVSEADSSGVTACCMLIHGHRMISVNCGDSRSIVVNKDRKIRVLTTDHRLDDPREAKKVSKRGGKIVTVQPIKEELLGKDESPKKLQNPIPDGGNCQKRLQLPTTKQNQSSGKDHKQTTATSPPGLHLSRSIGDLVAHNECGLSCEPDVRFYGVQEEDKIVIMASDGIWEHMSNQNVAAIAQAHFEQGAAEAAANAIVRRATQLWKENGQTVDDITCVVIFLDRKLIQKNLFTKQQIRKIEEEDLEKKVADDLRKAEKEKELAEISRKRRRSLSGGNSDRQSSKMQPADLMGVENESFGNFVSAKAAEVQGEQLGSQPAASSTAPNSTTKQQNHQLLVSPAAQNLSQLKKSFKNCSVHLEDILNEENIIQEDDDEQFTTQQTHLMSLDNQNRSLMSSQEERVGGSGCAVSANKTLEANRKALKQISSFSKQS